MKLTSFTRRLEECRKRWHRRTSAYVLEVARIVRGARKAARSEGRWGKWIREETRMNRTTVYRYLEIAKFLRTNDALKHQLASLSISKLYALSRLRQSEVTKLVRSGKAEDLSDVDFLKHVARLQPRRRVLRITRPNLTKSLEASVARLSSCIHRWQDSNLVMSITFRLRLKSRLRSMEKLLDRLGPTSAAAM